jgi:hypothetical protein
MPNLIEQKILNWVSDFCQSDSLGLFPSFIGEHAQLILETLLREASKHDIDSLEALTEESLQAGLLQGVARLGLSDEARPFVPSVCRAFLEDLQRRGRIGNGLTLGRYLGALKQAFMEASADKASTYLRPGVKIGRNDPCPCGSGKKYKKCCGEKDR